MIYAVITFILLIFYWMEAICKINIKTKKAIVFGINILWIIISTVRTVAAGDYYSYFKVFTYVIDKESFWNSIINSRYEPLYIILMVLCKRITDNYAFFNFVCYIIVAVLQYKAIKYWCKNVVRSDYLLSSYFIIWCLLQGNIFVIRQTIAIWICMVSFKYIEEKRLWSFLFCIIIATLFHYSTLVFVITYLIFMYDSSYESSLLKIIIYTIVAMFFIDRAIYIAIKILPNRISNNLVLYYNAEKTYGSSYNSVMSYGLNIAKGILNIAFVLVICYFLAHYKDITTSAKKYINVYLFSCIIYISLLVYVSVLARIATPFMNAQIPILLCSLKKFETRRDKFIWWGIISVYLIARMTVTIYSDYGDYLPLTTIFN